MKLTHVTIEGYRSIREPLTLRVDEAVTVIIGPNDHGKSNILESLLHLNPDHPFSGTDLNWDCDGDGENLPACEYQLELTADERSQLAYRETTSVWRSACLERAEVANQAMDAHTNEEERLKAELHALAGLSDAEDEEESGKVTEGEGIDAAKLRALEAAKELASANNEKAEAEYEFLTALAKDGDPDHVEIAIRKHRDSLAQRRVSAEQLVSRFKEAHSAAHQADLKAQQTGDSEAISAAAAKTKKASTDLRQAMAVFDAATQGAAAFDSAAGAWESGELKLPRVQPTNAKSLGPSLRLRRAGIGNALVPADVADISTVTLSEFIADNLPRVEIIRSAESISDTVTSAGLSDETHSFMRGIFYYAGLQKHEWATLFEQSHRNIMRLKKASAQLDKELKENWTQGHELNFELRHDSANQSISLEMTDPSVTSRVVSPAHRSSGFTHFFGLKTILHARQQESDSSSYIWVFDEPGVFLHPEGQFDLLKVLETISHKSQVLYSTHSIFMLNRNFPTRHRLVRKLNEGTTVTSKPYTGNWAAALSSIGLSLPATVLFAPKILLVEGDADPILLWSNLQMLASCGKFEHDTNVMAIMPIASDTSRADALIRILSETVERPKIAMLL